LAEAAYHLRGDEHTGAGKNIADATADAIFQSIQADVTLLTAADLPALSPQPGNGLFSDQKGLISGVYTNGDAAALVTRSSDALVISFRGTNDDADGLTAADFLQIALGGGTPDEDDWFNFLGI